MQACNEVLSKKATCAIAYLGAVERGEGRAAGPPLRAEPAKLSGGMRGPFGVSATDVGGNEGALEPSESSLCSIKIILSKTLVISCLAFSSNSAKQPAWIQWLPTTRATQVQHN